jgi:hypothetical protein
MVAFRHPPDLNLEGYEVAEAATGEEAWHYCASENST